MLSMRSKQKKNIGWYGNVCINQLTFEFKRQCDNRLVYGFFDKLTKCDVCY